MAYSNTAPAGEFGKSTFDKPVAANQRQARVMLKIIVAVAFLGLTFVMLGKFTGVGAERVV
ncbi:MAG: hypothetical protein ACRCT6_10915, partial [Notoacmeibacter sp.]